MTGLNIRRSCTGPSSSSNTHMVRPKCFNMCVQNVFVQSVFFQSVFSKVYLCLVRSCAGPSSRNTHMVRPKCFDMCVLLFGAAAHPTLRLKHFEQIDFAIWTNKFEIWTNTFEIWANISCKVLQQMCPYSASPSNYLPCCVEICISLKKCV